jgi:hypothetical protein
MKGFESVFRWRRSVDSPSDGIHLKKSRKVARSTADTLVCRRALAARAVVESALTLMIRERKTV